LFDRLLNIAGGGLVVALLAVVTAGIAFRAANDPLSWSDEASGYLMVWLACLGWMIATRHGAHIRIRFFHDKLPVQPKRATEAVIQAGLALFGAVVAVGSVHLVRVNSDIESIALPVTVAWMYAPMLPAGIMTLVQALIELQKLVRGEAVVKPTESQ
jgi:TRAP-type C4-dicarboxylate transport system permease small subunit